MVESVIKSSNGYKLLDIPSFGILLVGVLLSGVGGRPELLEGSLFVLN